jgi:hypothetical protein
MVNTAILNPKIHRGNTGPGANSSDSSSVLLDLLGDGQGSMHVATQLKPKVSAYRPIHSKAASSAVIRLPS